MSRVVLSGGGELDADTPAGLALSGCHRVAVVTLAAAYRRPDKLLAQIEDWADAVSVEPVVVGAVRRSECLDPALSEPIAGCDGVLILDGAPAHFVSAIKATPLLDAIVAARARGADVAWSGAAAAAVCASMVDDRGGALTVGLRLYTGVVVAAGWQDWPRDRRRRLRGMIPPSALFMALESGAAVQSETPPAVSMSSSDPAAWGVLGGVVEARRDGTSVALSPAL